MKKITVIIFSFVLSFNLLAQDGLSKFISNKLVLDYELNWGVVLNGEYLGEGLTENIKGTKYFNTLNVSYKVASRIGVTVGYGLHQQKGENSFNSSLSEGTEAKFTGNELQIGINYFFKKHRAPFGNHLTLFVNSQSFVSEVKDYPFLVGNNFSIKTTSIGIGYNYMWVINKKLPWFIKYGFSASIPIISNIKIPELDVINNPFYSYDNTPQFVVEQYQFRNYVRANIGFGYAF